MKQKLNKLTYLSKVRYRLKLYVSTIVILLLISGCNQKNDRLTNSTDTPEVNILKPTSFIDVPTPTVIPFHLDSVENVKLTPKQIPFKVQSTFKDPHTPESLKFSNATVLDTTKFIRTEIGKNGTPNLYTYAVYKDVDIENITDSIVTYKEVIAKQPKLRNTTSFVTMIDEKRYDLQYLTFEQGLPDTYVRSICEDSKGAVWMTTPKGTLIKYDGVYAWEYGKEEGCTIPLYVKNLFIDEDDTIWMGTREGMIRFDGYTFRYYNQGLFNDVIMDIKADPQKNIWIGTLKHGLLKMSSNNDSNQEKIEQYTSSHGLCSEMITNISIAKSGDVWLGSGRNCTVLLNKNKLTNLVPIKETTSDYTRDLVLDRNNNLWITKYTKIFKYNIDSNTLTQVILANRSYETLKDLTVDSKNRLWGNTFVKGAFVIQGSSFIWFDSVKDPKWVEPIAASVNDHVWMSNGKGLYKLKLNSFKFIPFDKDVFYDPTSIAPEIFMAEDNQDNLWMAFHKKIMKYDGTQFNVHHLEADDVISRITKGTDGELWIGGRKGIYKYHKDGLEFFELSDHSINTYGFQNMIDYGEDGLLANTFGQLYRIKDGRFWSYNLYEKLGVYRNMRVFSCKKDKWGRIWMGGDQGLLMLDNDQLHWLNTIEEIQDIEIKDLIFDKDDNLVISTPRNTMFKLTFDAEGNFEGPDKLISYTAVESLIFHYAYNSTSDHQGNIWLGTREGTYRLTPSSKNKHQYRVNRFSKKNGFAAGSVENIKFSTINNENTLWWTNVKNIAKLDLDNLQEEEKEANIPTVMLKDININQQFIDFKRLKDTSYTTNLKHHDKLANYSSPVGAFNNYPEFLSVPHTMNHLTFHFSAINWNAPQNIQYQYKVEGMDEAWSELSNTPLADYRNIPYGDHTLKVKAVNQSGSWSPIMEYPFTINPPWWLTQWAKTMWVLIAIGLISGLVQLRIRSIKKKIRKEESFQSKIFLLESKALRAQMNPHFIFNVINSIQSYVFLHSELEANKYINTFSKLLRMTLEMGSSDTISLDDEIRYLESYLALESIRIGDDFKSSITIDDTIDKDSVRIPCMLFQPIIENAIIHGLMPKSGAKKLTIDMVLEGNYLKGIVTDNGIGRLEASRIKANQVVTHKSMATRIMKERFDISNTINELKLSMKTIDLIEGEKPMGTKVILSIPVSTIKATRNNLNSDISTT
ncbi:hypothetical protein BFR04_14475 [Gaetbulibacter sp. 4G1]|nr:sensor histidine kinase [Gaetbulibacter sp. 4G1]PIA81366.1 hypothetical protein BFR04_14475 [Gaetbulibacter sp. 4G1]